MRRSPWTGWAGAWVRGIAALGGGAGGSRGGRRRGGDGLLRCWPRPLPSREGLQGPGGEPPQAPRSARTGQVRRHLCRARREGGPRGYRRAGEAKGADGLVESIRPLRASHRSAVKAHDQATNQLKSWG